MEQIKPAENNQPTLTEMNAVIGVFDGYKLLEGNPDVTCWKCDTTEHPGAACRCYQKYDRLQKDGAWCWPTELLYHTSWDQLMSIGEKIHGILGDMLKNRPPNTCVPGDLIEVDIRCNIGEYNKLKAHRSMYDFIIWYNEYRKNLAAKK